MPGEFASNCTRKHAEPGAQADVPPKLLQDVLNSAKECPGTCIHVVRAGDGVEIAGPEA